MLYCMYCNVLYCMIFYRILLHRQSTIVCRVSSFCCISRLLLSCTPYTIAMFLPLGLCSVCAGFMFYPVIQYSTSPPVCPACCLVKFTVNIVRYLWQVNKQSTICILHLFNLQFAKLNRSYFAKYSVQLSCYLWQTTR